MLNVLTIDVEDYFHVSAFEKVVRFQDWPHYESRIERNTGKLLSLVAEEGTKATFFVLGWVAEHYPHLVREIYKQGHEIACHGYGHKLIYQQTKNDFREDVRKAKSILEGITGDKVIGYRAPSFSVIEDTLWAFDVLLEEGFEYDSSIFPIRHDRYGIANRERFSHYIKRAGYGAIREFPLSTIRVFGINIPMAGGGYFRLFPYWLIRWSLQKINQQERQPFVFYLHPWEIDPEQPRLAAEYFSRFRHYINLAGTEKKFRKLLSNFTFTRVRDILAREGGIIPSPLGRRLG